MNDSQASHGLIQWHGTTIIGVKRGEQTVIAGDGQVSMGNTVMKPNARKVRRIGKDGAVVAGFAGATADAFTLFERLERKLEQHSGQLLRASVELAKDWRTDKYLRNLEALMIVADKDTLLVSPATVTCWNPTAGSPPSARAATTRSPPRGRFPITRPTRKRSRARPWPSPPTSASLPTAT